MSQQTSTKSTKNNVSSSSNKSSPTNNKVFIVQGNVKSNDQFYFAPHQLRKNDHHDINIDLNIQESVKGERKVSNASTDSSLSTPSAYSGSQNIYQNPVFQKKQSNYQTIDPIQKYFDQDLNLQFAEDSTKFLGKIINTEANYAIERMFIQTKDVGVKLYYSHFQPSVAKAKASILIVHGFCEHSGLYINFADYFVRQGFEVHMYDQRGFGYTGGITRNSSTEEFQQDLTTIFQLVDKSIPLYVYGHSTGTLGVLSYLINNPHITIAGLISLNAFLKVPKYFGLNSNKKILAKILLMFYEDLLVNSKINLSALCKNSYHIKKMIKDEHISAHLTLRMAVSIMEMSDFVQNNASQINVPIFLIHGKEDVVSKYENTIKIFNKVSSKTKDYHLIEGGFHQPHLDTNQTEIHSLINNWLNKRLPEKNTLTNENMFNKIQYGCKSPLKKQDFIKIGFIILFFIMYLLNKKGQGISGLLSKARCFSFLYLLKQFRNSK